MIGPGNWRYGVRDLWAGWFLDDTLPPQSIVVEPGDGTVRRGGDLAIAASAEGFDPATMSLFARIGPGGDWQSVSMDREPDDSFGFTFFALREPVAYYVTAAGVRSQEFLIDVVELPGGSDPDDFIRSEGASAYGDRLRAAPGYLQFLIDRQVRDRDLNQIPEQVAAVNALLPHILHLDNAVERAVTIHRSRNPAADHAAEPVAIYALRPADGLDAPMTTSQRGLAAQ